jgi:hypothetical protein
MLDDGAPALDRRAVRVRNQNCAREGLPTLNLEEIKACVGLAVGAFDDETLDPWARSRAAFEYLAAVSANRDFVPAPLEARFDELWMSFIVPPRRDTTARLVPDLATIARCERLTREFAQALERHIAEA